MTCSVCGGPLHPERAALGYPYCTQRTCVDKAFVPKTFVSVALPKSTPLIVGSTSDSPTVGLTDGRGARRW